MDQILEGLEVPSHVGQWVRCRDDTNRVLFPGILVKSADFEEQCVGLAVSTSDPTLIFPRTLIALTRGPHGSHPCTVCLVHQDHLTDLTTTFECHTAEQSKQVYDRFTALNVQGTMGQAEALMAKYSLRPVKESAFNVILNCLFMPHHIIRVRFGRLDFQIHIKVSRLINSMGSKGVWQLTSTRPFLSI
jgi:hypothetical protein